MPWHERVQREFAGGVGGGEAVELSPPMNICPAGCGPLDATFEHHRLERYNLGCRGKRGRGSPGKTTTQFIMRLARAWTRMRTRTNAQTHTARTPTRVRACRRQVQDFPRIRSHRQSPALRSEPRPLEHSHYAYGAPSPKLSALEPRRDAPRMQDGPHTNDPAIARSSGLCRATWVAPVRVALTGGSADGRVVELERRLRQLEQQLEKQSGAVSQMQSKHEERVQQLVSEHDFRLERMQQEQARAIALQIGRATQAVLFFCSLKKDPGSGRSSS